MIEFKNVSKHFGPTQVLHNIDLNIAQGEVVVIIGPSGSGKSTLLRCINKLEEITSGDLIVDGLKVNDPKVDERLIRQEAGMVFQQFYLFPHLTALENVELASEICKEPLPAAETLRQVGLEHRMGNFPAQLSGGEQQRVSIARALAKNPKILLCDEPTGALDYKTGKQVLALLQDTCRSTGRTVIVITHNSALTAMADRVIRIKSGQAISNVVNEHPTPVEEIEW